jgi:hypothetical protein
VWGSEFTTKASPKGGTADFIVRLNVKFWVLTACLPACVVVVVPAFPLEQMSLIWNSYRENVVVDRLAGRAGSSVAVPGICDAQRAPPRATAWAPRSIT